MSVDPSPPYYSEDFDWDDCPDNTTESIDDIVFVVDGNEQVYDVDEFDDIYANYQDAKAKMNALRTLRGFYPVVSCCHRTCRAMFRVAKLEKVVESPSHPRARIQSEGWQINPKGRAAAAMGSGAGRQLRLRCHPVATRRER